MKSLHTHRRVISTLMLSLVAATLFAQTASAGNAYGHRRWKGGPPVREARWVAPQPNRVVVVHHSDAGPIFAGLVGGLILGAAIANAQQPAAHVSYSYWDPYCHEGFVSLAAYDAHLRHYHHPEFVRVIDTSDGRCVQRLSWNNNGWQPCDRDGDWNN
jgi:hypothetical protein